VYLEFTANVPWNFAPDGAASQIDKDRFTWTNHQAINCICWANSGGNTRSNSKITTCYAHYQEIGGFEKPSIGFPFDYSSGQVINCRVLVVNPNAVEMKYRVVMR
jgi:hypothetical protein